MNRKPEWRRPRTTRAYLHPPLAERLALIWPDFKLIDAALLDNGTHTGQPGIGLRILHGEDMDPFLCPESRFDPVTPGLPFYTLRSTADGCEFALEAFCDHQRNPVICFRLIVTNPDSEPHAGCFGILPRSGCEMYLDNQHHEGYGSYEPNHKTWYMLKRTWKQTGPLTASDAMGALRLQSVPDCVSCRWITDGPLGHTFEAADYFRLDYALAPGAGISVEGAFRAHVMPEPFDYETAKAFSAAAWERILAPMAVVPDTDCAEYQGAYRHLAMQLCQMLACYEGSDLVTPRQGDLGRFVWPYEAAIFLTMLDRIGLRAHTADAYRYFLERWLVKDGPDKGKVGSNAGWENFTGSVIWGLSEHLKYTGNREELAEFLPYLKDMHAWIERRRHEPSSGHPGIFPSGKGSDWADVAQFWTLTDSYNAMGIRSYAEMLEAFMHEDAHAVRAAYEDYASAILSIRDSLYAGHENDDAYILPHELGLPFEDTENYSYYVDGAPMLLLTGFMEPGSRMREQLENFFRSRGQFERGMTGLMTNCNPGWDSGYLPGYGDVWYTLQSDYVWLRTWVEAGETEKADETLHAMMTYGLTREYIASERYCSINEWYSPWQPNASGSARVLQALLCRFGERRI